MSKNKDDHGTMILKQYIKDIKNMTSAQYMKLYDKHLQSLRKYGALWGIKDDGSKEFKMMQELASLVDGCYDIVEIWKAETPAQIKWKKEWLEKARRLVGEQW